MRVPPNTEVVLKVKLVTSLKRCFLLSGSLDSHRDCVYSSSKDKRGTDFMHLIVIPNNSVLANGLINPHKQVNTSVTWSKNSCPPFDSVEPELSSELLPVDFSLFQIFIMEG